MKVKILRRRGPDSEPYWETFDYDGPMDNSVAGLLDYLNYNDDIADENGRRSERIWWECSCMQGVCGACAMVINGVPALACETMISGLGGEIELRPLSKFPAVRDLIVDRSSISANLTRANVYIGGYDPSSVPRKEYAHRYDAAKCLKCGLCLEVCPNYTDGGSFFGAAFANDCYLAASGDRKRAPEVMKMYGEHFARACSKAFSCAAVCPAGIPTIASMAKLNRRKLK